jgi:hypothetical protein
LAFSQSSILDVIVSRDVARCVLSVTWTASDTIGAGTPYQVYVNGRLAWHGQSRQCDLPYPGNQTAIRIDVGKVAAGEGSTDFSSSLTAAPGTGNRPTLTWLGGKYLDPSGNGDVVGYYIYQGTVPGGAVSATPVATVPVYSGGVDLSGWGMGGWGQGGWGSAATSYSWTGKPLSSGTWNFAVAPFDSKGNTGTQATVALAITTPPNPPAPNSAGQRLTHTFPSLSGWGAGGWGAGGWGTLPIAQLNWNASP